MFLVSPEIVAELTRLHRQQLLDEAERDRALHAAKLAPRLLKAARTMLARSSAQPPIKGDALVEPRAGVCPTPQHAS